MAEEPEAPKRLEYEGENPYMELVKERPSQKLFDDSATRITGSQEEYNRYAAQNPVNRFEDVQFGQEVGWKQRRQEESARAQQQQRETTLTRDFEYLRNQTPEAVQDWELIGQYVYELDNMAKKQEDPELKQLADSILSSYGSYLEPHLTQLAGPEWLEGRVAEIEEPELGFLDKAGQALADVGQWFQQMEQGVQGSIAGVEAAVDTSDQVSAIEGLRHAGKSAAAAIDFTAMIPKTDGILDNVLEAMGKEWDPKHIETSAGKLSIDRNDDGTIDIFEALGKESASGWVETPIAIMASILFDPITYLPFVGQTKALATLGYKSAASIAPKYAATVSAKHLGKEITPELVESIAKNATKAGGLSKIPEADAQLMRDLIEFAGKEADGIKRKALFTRSAVDAQTDVMRAVEKNQAGLRWAGLQVPGTRTAANLVGDAARSAGILTDETFETVADWVPAPGQRNVKGQFASIPKGVDFDETTGIIKGADGKAIKGFGGAEYRMVQGSERLVKKVKPSYAKRAVAASPLADLAPRARLAKWGARGQDALGEALSKRRAVVEMSTGDVARMLGTDRGTLRPVAVGGDRGLWRKAIKDLGGEEGYLRRMNEILTNRDELKKVLAGETDDSEAVRKLVETTHNLKRDAYEKLRLLSYDESGLKMPYEQMKKRAAREGIDLTKEQWTSLEEWLPYRMSKSFKKNKEVRQQLANRVKREAGEGKADVLGIKPEFEGGDLGEFIASLHTQDAAEVGVDSMVTRGDVVKPGANLQEANRQLMAWMEAGNIKATKMLMEDPVAAVAAMHREVNEALANQQLLDDIVGLGDFGGQPMAMYVDISQMTGKIQKLDLKIEHVAENMLKTKGVNLNDYSAVYKPDGSIYMVHNDIKNELHNLRLVFKDPKFKTTLGQIFDTANNAWAAFATVSGLNVAFTARNAIGNLFNMAIKGFRNPDELRHAVRNQRQLATVNKLMRSEGLSYELAVRKLVKSGKLPKADAEILTLARKHGIINQGRSIDILAERTTASIGARDAEAGMKWWQNPRLKPWDPDSGLAHPGAWFGMQAENNARIAFFRDQLRKGLSPEIASQEVKKTLFDYGDLTRFESDAVRRISRFYTFTRKNLALQAHVLIRRPQAIRNAEKSVDAFLSLLGDEQDADGPSFTPPWMKNPIVRSLHFGGGNAALDFDTPWSSANETLSILFDPTWGESDPVLQMQRDNYISGLIERTSTLFSGVGVGVVEGLFEIRSEQDMFSGRDFSRSDDMRDQPWFRLASAFVPTLTRYESIAAKRGWTRDGDREEELAITAANLLLGVQAYAMREQGDTTARFVLQQELIELMQEVGGRESVDELRKSGELRMKDVVADILMYGWRKDENGDLVWDEAVVDDRLLAFVGADIRKAFGLPEPTNVRSVDKGSRPDAEEGSEEYFAQEQFDFKARLEALETWRGEPLTDDEYMIFASAMSGALSPTDLAEQGVEGYRENSLAPRTQQDIEERYQNRVRIWEDRMAVRGWNWDTVRERYPRISERQRDLNNARALGWSDSRIREAMWLSEDEGGLGWLSRNDRAYISQFRTGDRNGFGWITESRYPLLSDQERAKIQNKAWEAAEELKLMFGFEGWGQPTEREIEDYVAMNLTKAERKLLGIDTGLRGAPRREDIRPDDVKQEQAEQEWEALSQGILSPYIGSTQYGYTDDGARLP